MSKKSFLKLSWREVLVLFLIDLLVLSLFEYLYSSSCLSRTIDCIFPVCPQIAPIYCALEFFTDFQNLFFLFAVIIVGNFILSGIWHFVVKK